MTRQSPHLPEIETKYINYLSKKQINSEISFTFYVSGTLYYTIIIFIKFLLISVLHYEILYNKIMSYSAPALPQYV